MLSNQVRIVVIVMFFWVFGGCAWATSPKAFGVSFEFPDQGLSMNQEGQVFLNISNISSYQSGYIELALSAIPYVVPSSTISSISTTLRIEFGINENRIAIPLTITKNGEYEIRVSVNLQTQGGLATMTRAFGIVAEQNLVWFGRDSIDHAVEEKIQYDINSDNLLSPVDKKQIYKEKLKEEIDQRGKKSRANAGLSQIKQALRVNNKIVKGELLVIEAFWIGQGTGQLGTTTGDNNFPMHGAKITISDKDKDASNNPLTANITGYLVDGKFSFAAPRKDYSYKLVMETDFPGIKANGAIETTGSGTGSFQVVSQTSGGAVYICEAENVLSVVCNQAQTGSAASYSAWSAFHGVIEMIVQAKAQLSVNKKSGFKVIFDHGGTGSFYFKDNISISMSHRYEWDVVAHEFGHAIAKETNAIDTNTGGAHNGSNQYDYVANTSTYHDKSKSLELAISEGFGTWFGTALLKKPSTKYDRKFKGIGDDKYDDASQTSSANLEGNTARLLSSVSTAYGEDTEVAVLHLLWDIMDSNNESNSRATCTSCKDNSSLGLNGLWSVLNGSKISNIIELYEKILDKKYSTTVSDLLKKGENTVNDTALKGALNISYTFAEFGVAPFLEQPAQKTKLDLLKDKTGPKFEWSQKKTGTLEGLTEFTLVFYTFDKKSLVFKKTGISATEYTLTESDIRKIKSGVDALSSFPSSLLAVVVGENDYILELDSGPYLSNPIEIMINNIDRTLVAVVDSSGSNKTTDPSNIRIIAAKETLRKLTSLAESKSNGTTPDLAGAIDFDSSVTILSQLDDPDVVIPTLDSIDSSGGTDIAAGINSAVQILENLNTSGLKGIIKDKAAITVFTDGENNNGRLPVIRAIASATLKGIRVHYGFLRPFSSKKVNKSSIDVSSKYKVASDAPLGHVIPHYALEQNNALPSSIEEAVLASGGVYALIGNAESQVAFVRQIENRGFTNGDNSDPGGQSVVGQTETFDNLIDPLSSRSFQFSGSINETVRVFVNTNSNFHPFLKIFDKNGSVIAVDNDSNADGKIELSFTLPYSGRYHAEVTSQNGNKGLYSIFVDVKNASNQAPNSVIDSPVSDIEIVQGQNISFAGTGSDLDGNLPLSYLWSFGVGSGISDSTSEDPGAITFNNTGVFVVTFTSTDNLGLADASPSTITVTVKAVSAIPTLSEWGLILLIFSLFVFSSVRVRQSAVKK